MPINYGSNNVITDGYFVGKTKHSLSNISVTTSQVNNWDLSATAVVSVNLDSVSSVTTYLSVTGIEAGEEGEIKAIYNASTTKFIQLYHNNTSSLDSNRMSLSMAGPGYIAVLRMYPGGLVTFMYLNNKWRINSVSQPSSSLSFVSDISSFGSVGGGGV